MQPHESTSAPRWITQLTLGFVALVAIVFLLEFVAASLRTVSSTVPEAVDTEPLAERVARILEGSDVANGERLVRESYECHVCHIEGGGRIAPSFVGLGQRAAQHAPLSPEEYLYLAITKPSDYVVEGYPNAMPANYPQRLGEREIGDMVAYLLTQ
ncbi:MAG: cytochrome c [Anaerolineae bacterium]|nr:cytochrome c [Anaerolineae bacterium]MDW8173138.1 cytochrome c [Anaerolineae bacterium]